ncbi:MAG: Bug family tripartite tricarboxylate transporter substrate binding protein [Burkholderiaceae bacterium]
MKLISKLAGALSLVAMCQAGQAQDVFPASGKVVQLVYPFGAGGTDALLRVFAQSMSDASDAKFILVNKEGAAGAIGATTVARARPDGYTLMVGPSIVVTNLPYTQKDLAYGIDSFEYVCQLNVNALAVVVKQDSPFKTFKDLTDAMRANPGKFNYGHSGTYTDFHLNMLLLEQQANLRAQDIAYRGDAPTLLALLSGELHFTIHSGVSVAKRTDIRPLAVFWDRRHPALPDVPSVAELGYSAFFTGFQGVFAPKGTPKPVVQALSSLCAKASASEAYKAAASSQGTVVLYMNSEEFEKSTRTSYVEKGKLFRQLGVTPK